MKFSLKTLAAAVALAAAAGSASAAIDNGVTGNGELFFSAWDGSSSFTYDMGMSIDAYEATAASTSVLTWDGSFTSAYGSWLSTANESALKWNVMALDTSGQRRILSTVDGSLPALNKNNDVLRSAAGDVQQKYLAFVNTAISGNSLVTPVNTASTYAGKMGEFVFTKFNFDTAGSFSNDSYANGLGFEKTLAAATGIAAGSNNAYFQDGIAVRAWVDGNNELHIGVVPEPSEYALLLAGLGLMGVVARRRKNARV